MLFVENVIPALFSFLEEGQKVALVTLVGVDGSSPRPIGSQIGVAEGERAIGMITGGCAEKAIIAEALQCIERQENKIVRYGEGSPYLDVVLPCGSGIDIYIETRQSTEIIRGAYAAQQARETTFLAINKITLSSSLAPSRDKAADEIFVKKIEPNYRLFVFGEGANLVTFCLMAHTGGFAVEAYSPDDEAIEFLEKNNVPCRHIHQQSDFSALKFDPYTAVVTLFHEHEWEGAILHAALNSQADYIGALGSRNTHQQRIAYLAEMPATKNSPENIHGPVGLDIGAQSPSEISVSILAEIIEHRRKKAS